MKTPSRDNRNALRRALDDEIAAGPKLPPPELPPGAVPAPMEAHLKRTQPLAVAGIVENGLVRLLDPNVRLREHSRVIVVASQSE